MSANGNQVRSGSVVVSTETLSTSNSAPEPVTVVDVCGTAKQAVTVTEAPLQAHYNELLRVIGDIGRDVKPAYTSNKVSTDKLRKNIMIGRNILRDCQADLENLQLKATAKD